MVNEKEETLPSTSKDFYAYLNIEKTASDAEIKSAYRKLALKYHPDRNQGNKEAEEIFKQISTAYAVLSDPNKRRQYDISSKDGSPFDYETVDVEQMGGIGRLFGALFSKLGIPIPTQISATTLNAARDICDGRIDDHHKVRDLVLNVEYTGKTEKQECHFYSLQLTEKDVENGILLDCRSMQKSKFKLILFDEDGAVSIVKESMKNEKSSMTVAAIYLTSKVDLYDINKGWLNFQNMEQQIPVTFQRLCTLAPNKMIQLKPGKHLIGVYGDNWFSSLKYKLRAAPMNLTEDALKNIQEIETELVGLKNTLDKFQSEYVELRKKYLEAETMIEVSDQRIIELVAKRDEAYDKYTESCFQNNRNMKTESVEEKRTDSVNSSGKFQNIFSGLSSRLRSTSTQEKS